ALADTPGLPREVVALNAGAALYAADVVPDIAAGIALARATIASGAARRKLDDFIDATQRLGVANC
ncbi:MAG: anthranilate phosphoribosyltransferase, partial [Proteobacteria bacterium]|nr:anthranilate phosphoribosyltransferase [Pseudomonadota bacterium]